MDFKGKLKRVWETGKANYAAQRAEAAERRRKRREAYEEGKLAGIRARGMAEMAQARQRGYESGRYGFFGKPRPRRAARRSSFDGDLFGFGDVFGDMFDTSPRKKIHYKKKRSGKGGKSVHIHIHK